MAPSSLPEIIDTHCHFDFEVFDHNRESLWRDCQSQGLEKLIMPGVEPKQWSKVSALTERFPGLYFAAGIHPHWAGQLMSLKTPERSQLVNYLAHDHCVAIGECGMDGNLQISHDVQKGIFECHLQLACELNKPLIIHAHKAHHWIMPLLAQYKPAAGGVIHGFSGSLELAAGYWAKGFYLGVGGTITYERASKTRDTVTRLPLSAMLLETDAPDMPLKGFQGQANSPLQVLNIAKTLAQLRNESVDTIAAQTTANAHQLFGF